MRGGDGDDRIYVEGDDVVVRGDAGADRIRIDGPLNYYLFGGKPVTTRQHVARGGRGPDVLIGSDFGVADRLLGGRGHDRANGRKGHRDYCLAEVTRGCERMRSLSQLRVRRLTLTRPMSARPRTRTIGESGCGCARILDRDSL